MMTLPIGRTPRAEGSRGPLWGWPTASGAAAFGVALLLARIRPVAGSAWAALWPGDVDSASTALQAVVTTSVTVTTLTFSLTVVTLQLASQQFSPRLLRRYARDRATKTVLSVLTCTFVFSITTLAFLDAERRVPAPAVVVAMALGVASLAAVLAYLTHIVREVRVDSMMRAVHEETATAIGMFYPALEDPRPLSPDRVCLDEDAGVTVYASRSGFVRLVDVSALVECARTHNVLVRLDARPGDLVVARTPLATVWAREPGAAPARPDADGTADAVHEAVTIAYERTLDQDVAFGFRQLEDIAVKAMSPGINDPVTATAAVGHMADLLVRLADRRLGPTLHLDAQGEPRAIVPDRDLRYYLDLACGQLGRFAAAEPTVLVALLRMLRDLAVVVHEDAGRADEVRRAAGTVRDAVSPAVSAADAEAVHDLHCRVLTALEGSVARAYADRSGETRSV
ncbi:DUF2254 domain-containing protein [Streptomyces sp. DH12]|uniref:DUF2254 domain-containing protein n=1 Tax=Streptomyces sp. DH12 TaxID=2857010 RepID=UPI001E2C7F25|nr:DUF2254 domain-containing protein [Streptomyces sp. DH12]